MNWIEARISFDSHQPGLMAEAIAQVFHDLGLKGVVIDDPRLPQEIDWCDKPVPRPKRPAVSGYFSEKGNMEQLRKALEEKLKQLAAELGFFYKLQYRSVNENDWAGNWKKFFKPTLIGRRLVVKPSWYAFEPRPDQLVVEIDPGMAFGTGLHASTSLSMVLLEKHLRPGSSLLDVGCGSGILMVTAARLGARLVWGTDNDPLAVEVAAGNMRLNRIDPRMFRVLQTDLVKGVKRSFTAVAANILAPVILKLIPQLEGVLQTGGIFFCSGIITNQSDEIALALEKNGFKLTDRIRDSEWVAMAARLG